MTARLVKQTLVTATLITVGGNVLGRVFGFAREAVLAKYFGTSAVLDTFILAFTLPELVALILFTALPVALIPIVSKRTYNITDDSRLFWSGLILFVGCFAVLSAAIYLLRGHILAWLAPGLGQEHAVLGQRLLAILAPYVLFRGLEAYFRSWCFARKHFVAPALSSVIINTVVIASIFLWYDQLHVETLAYGWLAGSAILLVYNAIFAFRLVRPTMRPTFESPWIRRLLGTLGAIALLECFSMVYTVVDRYLASQWLGPGPISALRYASTLISIPGGVLVAAFNIASFPWIADMISCGDSERLKKMYTDSVRLLIFTMSLIAVGILIFSDDIIRVAFMRGAFDNESLLLTTGPFMFYAIGLVFQAVYGFQMRFYYARQALLRLGLILVGMLGVKLVASVLLIGPMGHSGLALATSLARVLGFIAMTIDLARTLDTSHRGLFAKFVPRVVLALAVVAAGWTGVNWLWPSSPDQSLLGLFIRLAFLALAGIAAYAWIGSLLKLQEPRRVIDLLVSQFRRDR